MLVNQAGVDLIKKFEDFRSHPYLDVVNIPTIGYGTTHYPGGRAVTIHDNSISRSFAETILREELKKHYAPYVEHYVTVPLNQNQFNALVSFVYNLGVYALKKSTLLKKLNAGDYDGASREFLKWTHAGGRELPGLVTRRGLEKELFDGGYSS